MTDCNHKFFGASLIALAFSVSTTPAAAQTCAVPPSCETLGFTLAATDCVGKTILKCPFDQNKIYCPSDIETAKTYALGDTYISKGVAIGRVISVTDCGNGSSSSNIVYSTVRDCLGTNNYSVTYDSVGNQIWSSPDTDIICMYGRYYQYNTSYRYGYMRISGSNGQKCLHGTISSPVVRYGTIDEATKTCAAMTSGDLTWYLPSTYNGFYFGYDTGINAMPYMQGLWAVANGCFYNGTFYAIGSSGYESNCQNRTGSCCPYTYTDKKLSYYCIAMF